MTPNASGGSREASPQPVQGTLGIKLRLSGVDTATLKEISAPELEEAEENIRILVRAALEVDHRLEGHPEAIDGCPICHAHGRCPGALNPVLGLGGRRFRLP